MFCPGCGAANVEGAKFCGACGVRIEAVAPTAVAPAGPPPQASLAATSPTVVRAPRMIEPSAASLPVRGGGRGKLFAVLALDVGLVVAGLVLATRPPAAATTTGTPRAPTEVAQGSGTPIGDGSADGSGGARPSTGTGGSSGSGGSGGTVRPSTGTGANSGTGSGSGTGSTTGSGSIDARSLDDRLTDAAVAPAIDAGGEPVVTPIVDAAAPPTGEPDAAATVDEPDAGADDELSVAQLQAQFTRLAVGSDSRFARCYQSATKALPDDQPLRGEVDIELAVMPTGQTENVRVDRNTTGSQTLADCVIGVARSWSFSRHSATESLQFKRTLTFGPSGEAGR